MASITVALTVVSYSGALQAEPCGMIGCTGEVGMIFMPSGAYSRSGKLDYHMDGRECQAPPDDNPFGGNALPEVNSVVAISIDNTPMISADAVEAHLDGFKPPKIMRDTVTGGCNVVRRRADNVPSDTLRAGSKVRILGYQAVVGHWMEQGRVGVAARHDQLLFAIVLVVSDGR